MFSKTAARSKGYFSGLPAAAIAMGHSTVVQPFRRMRTKVRKTTAKFRRHAPPAPAVDESVHNAGVLSPVLPPLSPLDTETWWRRSPSPPRPSSSASSTQNRSQSPFQPHDTEDIDAGSTSQVRRNSLWDQRFLPGLRIPTGFAMNNDASGQLLSPITPLHSPVSPSPLYPSDMISPTSFYSRDSIPNNDLPYSSTIDTTMSLTTPITDIFTNTYTSNESETDGDFTPYDEFTNTQRFRISEPTEYTTNGQTNPNITTTPYIFQTNALMLSGSEAVEYTVEGQYGARMKELPSPHILDIQDIDTLELGPPAKAPTIIELPAETSLRYALMGQEFAVTITQPIRQDAAFDVQAVDEIHRDMVSAPLPLAKIDIEVIPGCQDVPYAAKIVNDIFSVLQAFPISPDCIAVQLPSTEQEHSIMGLSHACLHSLKNIPPLVPWWRHGRMAISQLSRLTLLYPLPINDLVELLVETRNLEVASVGLIIKPESTTPLSSAKNTTLGRLTAFSIKSAVNLEDFFDLVDMPSLRSLNLDIMGGGTPDTFDIRWEYLQEVKLRCQMTQEAEEAVRDRCTELIGRQRFECITT